MPAPNSKLAAAAVGRARLGLQAQYDKTKGPVLSLGPRQKASRLDRGPSATVWTVPVDIPAPREDDARDAVLSAVANLGDGGISPLHLQSAPVVAEWVGMRRGEAPETGLEALNRENQTTIMFLHGGGYFQGGLGTSRPTAAKLSAESGGRVLVVDYRLAPQNAFPSQILDVFIAYLSLLYPPPGSLHAPVRASSIVLAGESVGGALGMALLQVLLQLGDKTLLFHGQRVSVPMPAGIAVVSCLGEQVLCLPSWETNKQFDIWDDGAPFLDPDFPADEIWPSDPPRKDLYCEAAFLHHPMVSPCTADSWKGAPPMWFSVGQERMADSSKIIAQTAYNDGVSVQWSQYEAMPHCWMFFMPKLPQAIQVYKRWGEACRQLAEADGLESRGCWIGVEKLEESAVDLSRLTSLVPKEARNIIKAKVKTMKVFHGKRPAANL